jgi:hypothetical protein
MTATTPRVIWRYVTLGGALVIVTRHEGTVVHDGDVYDWKCLGCGTDQNLYFDGQDVSERTAQRHANQHAGECRSLPSRPNTDEPSAAAGLAGIRAELTGVRQELANVAEVMRELAVTVDETLLDVANAISDLPDPSEGLADIATAVESLVIRLKERPRRIWRKPLLAGRRADEAVAYEPVDQEETEGAER